MLEHKYQYPLPGTHLFTINLFRRTFFGSFIDSTKEFAHSAVTSESQKIERKNRKPKTENMSDNSTEPNG